MEVTGWSDIGRLFLLAVAPVTFASPGKNLVYSHSALCHLLGPVPVEFRASCFCLIVLYAENVNSFGDIDKNSKSTSS